MKLENIAVIQGYRGNQTRIYRKDKQMHTVFCLVKECVSVLCIENGCTLEGCLDASNYLLDECYKLPIFISSMGYCILVPTQSPYSDRCTWINLEYLLGHTYMQINSMYRLKLSPHMYRVMVHKGIALKQRILENGG